MPFVPSTISVTCRSIAALRSMRTSSRGSPFVSTTKLSISWVAILAAWLKPINETWRRVFRGGKYGLPSSRHPRHRTRSPSSHNTARLLAPPTPNDEDIFIWPRSRHGYTAGYKISRVQQGLVCRTTPLVPGLGPKAPFRLNYQHGRSIQPNGPASRPDWLSAQAKYRPIVQTFKAHRETAYRASTTGG